MKEELDFNEKVIQAVGDKTDEVVIVLSEKILEKAGIPVGDKLNIVARKNELIIRKGRGD